MGSRHESLVPECPQQTTYRLDCVVKRAVQGHSAQSRRSTGATSSTRRAFPTSQTAALSPCGTGPSAPAPPHPLSVSDSWGPVSEGTLRMRQDSHFTEQHVLKACGHRGLC